MPGIRFGKTGLIMAATSMVIFALMSGCGKRPLTLERLQQDQARLRQFHTIIPSGAKPVPLLSDEHIEEKPGRREGPSWWNGKLYFSDQMSGIYTIEADGSCKHFALEKSVGTRPLLNGNLAVCTWQMPDENRSFKTLIVELAPDGSVVGTLADAYKGDPLGIPNDLVEDRKGGIYFSDPWAGRERIKSKLPGTAFFYRRPDGEVILIGDWGEFGFPNGCVLTPDGSKLFINDSTSLFVWVYDVNDDGTLSNKRVFCEIIPDEKRLGDDVIRSEADGMALDRSGNLFVACEIGVHVYDKTGKLIGIIDVPNQPSNCVFGGDDLSTLYITALNQLYSIRTNTKGYQYPIW